jgi:multiple sugar transport system ATP-binding protein
VTLPLKSAPAGLEGTRCVYGIRPEHLSLGTSGLEALVTVLEPTGSETQVFAKLGANKIVGVFRERVTAKPGESLYLTPNLDAVHLFDAETGARLN